MKIESIKAELDNFYDDMKKQLCMYKSHIKK
jgi:hypothetical protein